MATLGITFTGAALSMGGKKAEDPTTPPINAKSSEEESFVKCVHIT
jgi:F-type H+-transporting ATPase subunit k